MRKRYLILAGILSAALVAAGCGKKAEEDKTEKQAQVTVAADKGEGAGEDLVDMQKTTGENSDIKNVMGAKTETSSQLVIINGTGAEVAAVYIRPNTEDGDDDEWGDDLVNGAFTLKDKEKALYYYDKDAKDDEGKAVTAYDIRITYTDEERSECFFRKIPLPTVTQITLLMDGKDEDAIPYASYVTQNKKTVSTLQEVKKRLGLTDDGSSSSTDSTDSSTQPTQAPEQTQAPADGDGNNDGDDPYGDLQKQPEDPIKTAESYIGKSLNDLIGACGEPTSNSYEDEPETGQTGYHYYDTFTVSTSVDEDGNEVVAGVW